MTCKAIQINDVGTVFRLTVIECTTQAPLDLSSANPMTVVFKKPDGATLTKTGVWATDGTDGIVTYTTIAGDIDQVGNWYVQAAVTVPGGSFRSSVALFRVESNL